MEQIARTLRQMTNIKWTFFLKYIKTHKIDKGTYNNDKYELGAVIWT